MTWRLLEDTRERQGV